MHWPFVLILGAFLTLGAGCSSDDDESSDPSVIGEWQSTCALYYADSTGEAADTDFFKEEAVCDDPDADGGSDSTARQACVDELSLFYYQDTLVFADPVDETETYPTLTFTRKTYYNSDEDEAATCASADEKGALSVVWEYQTNQGVLLSTSEVTTENGFPDSAKSINAQLVSATLSHADSDEIAHLNDNYACGADDWASDTAMTITNTDHCLFHGLNLTIAEVFQYYDNNVSTYDSDGKYESAFISGTQFYSIFRVDESTSPNTLHLGDFIGGLESTIEYDADDDAAKTQTEENGSNEAHRQKEFFNSLTFQ